MSEWLVLCTGTTTAGRRCVAWAMTGSDRRWAHDGEARKVPPEEQSALRKRLQAEQAARVLAEWQGPGPVGCGRGHLRAGVGPWRLKPAAPPPRPTGMLGAFLLAWLSASAAVADLVRQLCFGDVDYWPRLRNRPRSIFYAPQKLRTLVRRIALSALYPRATDAAGNQG